MTFNVHVVDASSGSVISGASVYLDGSFAGSTDSNGNAGVSTTYPPANHAYRVSANGYQSMSGTWTIGASSGGSLTVRLTSSASNPNPNPQPPSGSGEPKVVNLKLSISPNTFTTHQTIDARVSFQLQGQYGASIGDYFLVNVLNIGKLTLTYDIAVERVNWPWDHEVFRASFTRTLQCTLSCAPERASIYHYYGGWENHNYQR